MKITNTLFFIFLIISLFACKEDVIFYKTYEVDFYTSHKDYVVHPIVFDTVTEIILTKSAHLEGATFETVTEQILVKEGYNKYRIMDSMMVELVTDEELETTTEIVCYRFFGNDNISETQIPSEYTTRFSYLLLQQGTGAEVAAVYDTINRIIIDTPPEFSMNTEEQNFKRITFKIPEQRTIRGHLNYYFERASVEHCIEGNSYDIHD